MKSKLLGIALFGLTLGAILYYPQIAAKNIPLDPSGEYHVTDNPKIDVVFVDGSVAQVEAVKAAKPEKLIEAAA